MFEALQTSSQTYSGTSYATITGLTLTPGAGTYLAIVTCTIKSAISDAYHYLGLAVDGSDIAHSEREHQNENSITNTDVQMTTHAVITVGAGEVIQARWRASATGTLTLQPNAGLTLISVAPGDVDQNTATSNTTVNSATATALADMSHGTPGAGDYLLVFTGSFRAGDREEMVHIAVYVGGVKVAHTERKYFVESSLLAGTSYVLLIAAKVSPGASDAVEVRWWRTGSNAATCHERNSTLIGNRTVLEVSGTTADTATNTTDTAMDDQTHTTPAEGDYLAINSWVHSYDGIFSVGQIITPSFYVGSGQVTSSERFYDMNTSLDDQIMRIGMFNAQKVSPSGSENVIVNWRNNSTDPRRAEQRTFVLLLDGASVVRELEGFRFRADDGSESGASWLASQDVNISRAKNVNTRVRVLVDTDTADPPSEGVQLEYRKVGDAATEWRKVPLT